MKLLFLNGSRGEWGYIQPLVDLCRSRSIDYEICATNMLMLPAYGALSVRLRAEGYHITDELHMSLEGHTHHTMTKSLGLFLTSFTDTLHRVKPTWLITAGDRGEQLMGAIAAAYTYTPVAHIQAGELSGNIDGVARHAIGKFAHLHFAANADAAERLRKLGEEEFRIHQVGHPALDPLVAGDYVAGADVRTQVGLAHDESYITVVLHPVTEDAERVEEQVTALVTALRKFPQKKVWILSNNDAGSARLRDMILKERTADMLLFENLPRERYLGLIAQADAIVGNSSSGLLEAPTFGLPAVNIGRRQHGRLQAENVLNVPFDADAIAKAIASALHPAFRKRLHGMQNPYGDGRSAERILDVLSATPINDALLVKRLTY